MKKGMCLLLAIVWMATTVVTVAAVELQPLQEYVAEQEMLMEMLGTEGDPDAYRTMEAYVFGGNTTQSLADLCYFYYDCLECMVVNGQTDSMQEMTGHFVQMAEEMAYAKGISQLNPDESALVAMLGDAYGRLLGLTDQTDDLLIAAINRLADYYLSYVDEASPETDPLYEMYAELNLVMCVVTRVTALAYSGETEQAISIASEIGNIGVEPLLLMLSGKPREAAQVQAALYDQVQALEPTAVNEYALMYYYQNDLNTMHAYEMRGIVSLSDCLLYADSLPKKYAFVVLDAPTEGVEDGFVAGDQIVEVNGIRAYAPQQMLLLRSSGENTQFTVLRDGEMVTITPPRVNGNRFGITLQEVLVDSGN